VFFDVRNSSDALFNLYNISLSGVEDLQLMKLAYRPGPNSSKKYLADLATCVEQSSLLLDAQKREWERGSKKKARMFDYQQILDAPMRVH
jgi:exonuclease 3'-5' domain-containing protein 1